MRQYLKPLLLALAVAACGESATGPVAPGSGALQFSYGGAIAGSFAASGLFDTSQVNPWAGAWRLEEDSALIVGALLPRSDTTHDVIGFVIPRLTPGTAEIAVTCSPGGCANFVAVFGRTNNADGFEQGCILTSGTLTIATITATRVTGTFAGEGLCFGAVGDETSFAVTNGAFDAPVAAGPPPPPR